MRPTKYSSINLHGLAGPEYATGQGRERFVRRSIGASVIAFWSVWLLITASVVAAPRVDRDVDGFAEAVWTVTLYRVSGEARVRESMVMYDEEGNRIQEFTYGSKGEVALKSIYVFEGQARPTRIMYYNPDNSPKACNALFYDEEGYRVRGEQTGSDGSALGCTVYMYDDFGDEIARAVYDSEGSLISETRTAYDDRGRITEKVTYGPGGVVSRRAKFEYDPDRGHLVRESGFDDTGEYFAIYESNRYGNWVQRTTYRPAGPGPNPRWVPAEVHVRDITYYGCRVC